MRRLTTDKKVENMSMVELAHNCCYAKDKKARYRDYDIDIDAREFTRKLMCEKGYWEKDDAEMISDDIFDNSIMDNLMYEAKENTGLIALFYRNLWAMADLREKLKAYEDINDDPEKLKLVDELYLERCEEINRLKAELTEKEENFCEWEVWDEEANAYHTSCENAHFIVDGSPKDNDYVYCPYCGRKLKEVQDGKY